MTRVGTERNEISFESEETGLGWCEVQTDFYTEQQVKTLNKREEKELRKRSTMKETKK